MKKKPVPRRRPVRPPYAPKAGLPPGSIVYVGDLKVDRTSFTLFDYDADRLRTIVFDSLQESRQHQKQYARLWLATHGVHDPQVMKEIGNRFHLHPLVLEDIANTQQRPKLEEYDGYFFVVLRAFHYLPEEHGCVSEQISLVIGKDFLLSFQEQSSKLFDPIRIRLQDNIGNLRNKGSGELMHALMDAVVDQYFVVVEAMNRDIEELEDGLISSREGSSIEEINRYKREILDIRRAVWPLREVLGNIQRLPEEMLSKDAQLYFRDVYDHVVHVIEQLDFMRDLIGSLLDIYLSFISNRLNAEVRILTIITTAFAPATLLTGFFGMNFHHMPWLARHDGWLLVVWLIMVSALALLAALFWKRWWPRLRRPS